MVAALAQNVRTAGAGPADLVGLDTGAYRREVGRLLQQVSELARARGAQGGPDLTGADLSGAALRGADLRGAELAGAIFLTQPRLEAARGDVATTVPAVLGGPTHWPRGRATRLGA